MATWPNTLQQKLLVSGFSIEPRDNTISTTMDVGPAKKRRRTTDVIDDISGSIHLDMSEYTTLMNFYKNDTASGTLPFDVLHPITEVPVQARFTSTPKTTPLGGRKFIVTMSWEILP